jgi:predicted metalloenzyme YecM
MVDLTGEWGTIQELQEPLSLREDNFSTLEVPIPPAESYSPAHNYEIIFDYLVDESYSPSPDSSFTIET